MNKVTRKFISLILVLTLTMSLFSQGVLAKNNTSNPSSNVATNSQELLFKTEEGLYGSEMIAAPYDETALLLLNEFIATTTSSALTISISDETITENDESSDELYELVGSNFEDLILQYQDIIENDYLYGAITTDSSLLDIKHKIVIQIHELQKNTDLTDDNLAMLENILFNFRKSNELISKNSLQLLSYLVSNVENKGTSKNVEAKLKVALNHFDKTDDFHDKGLIIPEFKSYENSYSEVLKGLDKLGIELSEAYFDTEIDTDGDTLVDGYELLLGLNPYNSDTDSDGLDDNIELITNPYCDPLLVDTDSDGIIDMDEDIDEDGLSNYLELGHNTFMMVGDSDEDGLLDGFEVNQFNTSPTLYDTDSDGLSDGDEYAFGTDPNSSDTDNDGTIDSNELYTQTIESNINLVSKPEVKSISVTFTSNKNISKVTTITPTYGIDPIVSNVVGLVGSPVDIKTEATFDEAIIKFSYDEELLGTVNEENLGVLWFNEADGEFVLLDSQLDIATNTISVITTHFSEYMLVDKQQWYDTWRTELDYGRDLSNSNESQYYDIILAIDSSGSMSWNDPTNLRLEAAKNFVDAFIGEDQGAVVDFDNFATIKVHLTKEKEIIKAAIDTIDSSGGTNIDTAINTSISELVSEHANVESSKIIILLTDGDGYYNSSTTQKAISNDILVHTVGLGSGVNQSLLETIATQTGGNYYEVLTSDQLEAIFERIQDDTVGDLDTTDTDGDGIYDIVESTGFRIQNGQIIVTDPNNPDTDGDGKKDGEEVIIQKSYTLPTYLNGNRTDENYVYYYVSTDPLQVDDYNNFKIGTEETPINENTKNTMQESQDVYNSESYKSIGDFFDKQGIITRAELTYMGGPFLGMTNASRHLKWFLEGYMDQREIDFKNMINDAPMAYNDMLENLNLTMDAAEVFAREGEEVPFVNIEEEYGSVSPEYAPVDEDDINRDWWYAVGLYRTWTEATVSKDGDTYTMTVIYHMRDFYDWEKDSELKGGFVTDGEMDELHRYGLAKEYELVGECKIEVMWEEGERYTVEDSTDIKITNVR